MSSGAERITMNAVTDNYFSLLGVQPALGRLIQPNEGRARGDAPVLVLTHEYWQSGFGGDPSVVGRHVRLSGRPFTIIGVAAPSFDGAQPLIRVAAYVPLWMHDDLMPAADGTSILERRDRHRLWVLGRLKPGATLEQARASLVLGAAALAREHPVTNKGVSLLAVPETHARPNPNIGPYFRVAAAAVTGLAMLLLLITSANVTNLLMARAATREREVALRVALGARRGRLVRQLLTEAVVLAVVGSVVSLPVVIAVLRGIEDGTAASTAVATLRPDFSLDVRVFVATFAMALLAGVVAGLAPALFAVRADLNLALKAGGRRASGPSSGWLRSGLVVVQVALSLVLLV
ncbi:MAG: ABC transporter permease, partial [Dongiaceae bacterium]